MNVSIIQVRDMKVSGNGRALRNSGETMQGRRRLDKTCKLAVVR